MDARRFFDDAIPQLAERKNDLFGSLSGNLAFIVRGVGAWTVHLGNFESPVVNEAEKAADLVLSFEADAFEQFIAGTLNLDRALETNQVAHDGDLDVLVDLSRLLAAQSPSS